MPAKIYSGCAEATSQYGAHMGTCHHYPATGWARLGDDERTRVELSADQYPGLDAGELEQKAVAIIHNRRRAA